MNAWQRMTTSAAVAGLALGGGGCTKVGDAINAALNKGGSTAAGTSAGSTATTTGSAGTTSGSTATTLAANGSAIKVAIPNINAFNNATDNANNIAFTHTQTVDASNQASATAVYSANGGSGAGTLNRSTGTGDTAAVQEYIQPGKTSDASTEHLLVMRDAGASRLTDMSYGIVVSGEGASSAKLAAYHYGNPTAASSMPTTTATYAGTWRGVGLQNGGSFAASGTPLQGAAQMNADFGAGTVSGAVTNIQSKANGFFDTNPGTDFGLGMTFNGKIDQTTKNTFTGTVGLTNQAGTAAAGSVTASSLNGGFYGTGAKEAGAATYVAGSVPDGKGGTAIGTVVGAFGAKKQ